MAKKDKLKTMCDTIDSEIKKLADFKKRLIKENQCVGYCRGNHANK